jgi:hypothetical protein
VSIEKTSEKTSLVGGCKFFGFGWAIGEFEEVGRWKIKGE